MPLQELLAMAAAGDRVCLRPQPWSRLYRMLNRDQGEGAGSHLPAPLILAAWHETTDDQKAERFRLHLRHAQAHGLLDEVAGYLHSLGEDDWHHRGE